MKNIITILCIIILGTSCDITDSNNNQNYSTAMTNNITDGSFYYDLATSTETTIDGNWQFSFQMLNVDFGGQTYSMPSLVLNTNPGQIMAAVYNNISFDELSSIPSTFSTAPYSDAISDLTSVQYGGNNEIISYNMQTHNVSINDANEVLLIYSMTTHKTWKIQFVEYNSGVILFNFSEL